MKKVLAIVLAVVMLSSLGGVAMAGQGNDLPSGPHYNLNLIGKTKDMPQGDDCDSGNRIFVQLDRNDRVKTKINLTEGEFSVLDCDGTDGVAEFQLPDPDENNDGVTSYSVFIRLRGKPGGDIIMETCGVGGALDEQYCSDLKVVEVRSTGPGSNKFTNVSAELLYIYAWVCTAEELGECTEWTYMRVPLFAEEWEGFFWDLDNNGARLIQLRFYPDVETRVPDPIQVKPSSADQGDGAVAVTLTADAAIDFDIGEIIITAASIPTGADTLPIAVDSTSDNKIYATITVSVTAWVGDYLITVTHDGITYITSFEVQGP
jgi:hypothetical protein